MMSKKVSAYLLLAETELAAARCLYTNEFDGQAMYYVSQAAEKAARAIIETSGVSIGRTHSFDQLGSMLDIDHPHRERILDFDEALSGASTQYRYPTEAGIVRLPTQERVEHFLLDVEAFIEEAKSFVGKSDFKLRR